MRKRWVVLLTVVAAWPGQQALGWGGMGHEWATSIAIETLPEDVPAFVRDPAAPPDLALMGRELDRSTGTGESRTGGTHYIEPSDDGDAIATFR